MWKIELNLTFNNDKIVVQKNKYDQFTTFVLEIPDLNNLEETAHNLILENFGINSNKKFNINQTDDLIIVNYKLSGNELFRMRLNRKYYSFTFENQPRYL